MWHGMRTFSLSVTDPRLCLSRSQAGENADELLAQKKQLEDSKVSTEEELKVVEAELLVKQISIGNIVHDSVKVSNDEVRRALA